MVKRLEAGVPSKIKINFSVEDKLKYQKYYEKVALALQSKEYMTQP